MAEKTFYNWLSQKLTTLRPSEQYREEDWLEINHRLDKVMPLTSTYNYRMMLLPLLLIALLLSNFFWWQSSFENLKTFNLLEDKIRQLETTISNLGDTATSLQTDTIWKTIVIYEKKTVKDLTNDMLTIESDKKILPDLSKNNLDISDPAMARLSLKTAENDFINKSSSLVLAKEKVLEEKIYPSTLNQLLQNNINALPARNPNLLKISVRKRNSPDQFNQLIGEPDLKTEPKGLTLFQYFQPKYYKIGLNTGLIYAVSPGLMHQGGHTYGARGEIGFSRHWSLSATLGKGNLHYKAHSQEAIVGSPELPLLPSSAHHYSDLDITGQKLIYYHIGLRYTFLKIDKPHPYVGLGWGNQIVQPFQIEYETLLEPYGTIQKGTLMVNERIKLNNTLQFEMGLNIPISKKIELTLEGFYQRLVQKTNNQTPDLVGVRSGLYFIF